MKSQNFEFLRPENHALADLAALAEAVLHIDPGSSLTRLRSFAEELTKSIYQEERLPRLPQASFYEMTKSSMFSACVDPSLIHQINYLRIQGNDTAHGAQGEKRNACTALGTAYQLAIYMGVKYYGKKKIEISEFKDIPDPGSELVQLKKSNSKFQKALEASQKEVKRITDELDKERIKTQEALKAPTSEALAERRKASQQVADSLQWNEAKTRAMLIDALLLRAGWDVKNTKQVTQEHPVEFPDNPSGKGFVDYVLWADNGQPLAIVEAKRSGQESPQVGREQAVLYANAMEHMGYQRPVIFYTNGYETYLWDDHQDCCDRQVFGIYSKDSLDHLIYQRHYRVAELEKHNPELSIADRPYQIEAIKTVAHRFQEGRRKALIIQATGTGKTRVAIALGELLLRTGWAKRVLFLCDRVELRNQADEAFKQNLPSEPRCVVGESNDIATNARIYIATYPSMMNRFDKLNVGFFDLIIADESHRSIYNRYRDLFIYFDALQVGLTATPVKFISRNTFDLFDCEDTDPTFEFGLDEAINNEPPYLVDYRVKDMSTDFLREGIHYQDLTEDQQRQLEEDLGEEQAQQTTIAGKDIGRKIFSEDTDRLILENLMDNGIKDETGSLVGKTIVFAQRQDHAEHLEKLFCKLYPQHGNAVCKVIHNKVSHVQSVIKEFKKKDTAFRIAISVDMLDTGIDVPEVVNLVFAKPVKSWVKFWQMIGRGTRLCPNLFGKGQDKTEFYIFDHYSNFQFFEEEYKEPEDVGGKSLLQTTFEARLELAKAAFKKNHREGFDTAQRLIRADINDLPDKSIAVMRHLRLVHVFQQTDCLQRFEASVQHDLATIFAPLMASRVLKDKFAVQFDKLMANLEQGFIEQSTTFEDAKDQLLNDIDKLAINIQAVRQKDEVIAAVRGAEFWQTATIERFEWVRTELRGIMQYRNTSATLGTYGTATTKTKDSGPQIKEVAPKFSGEKEALQYRKRLKSILDDMKEANPALQKIHQGETVTEDELRQLASTVLTSHPGVKIEVLNDFYGRTADQLYITIRELVGLDAEAVENHFKTFLHEHPTLTAKQVRFMNMLKKYISEHGSIVVDTLYKRPFVSISHDGVDGVFKPKDVDILIKVLKPFLKPEDPEAPAPEPH